MRIARIESKDLTPAQSEAIKMIVRWFGAFGRPEFYLAGYAGTGKSTILEFALQEICARYNVKRIVIVTFMGKAADVLRRKGHDSAQTLHSAMYRVEKEDETGKLHFTLDLTTSAIAEADLVVVDEGGMVNKDLGGDLRLFGKKTLVMMDLGQLPPVNGDCCYADREPDIFLTEVHRQALESPIIRLATMARKGERIKPGDYGEDVVVKMLTRATAEHIHDNGTQVICGVHRVRWTITAQMRERLERAGPLPLAGEPIMIRKNNKEEGIFNGQSGFMTRDARELEPRGPFLADVILETADPDGRRINALPVHPWLFEQHANGKTERPRIRRGLHEMDWSYARTGHGVQGDEFPHVTIIDDSASFREDRDRWLYTVLTRPTDGLTLLKRAA